LARGADPSIKNNNGMTSLDLAEGKSVDPMENENLKIMKLLKPKEMPHGLGPRPGEEELNSKIPELPDAAPTHAPTAAPTYVSTAAPTHAPTAAPTYAPTAAPTYAPTAAPTHAPTAAPTYVSTAAPTYVSTEAPTYASPAALDSNPSSPNDGGTNTGLIIAVVVTCVVVVAIVAGFILVYYKKSKEKDAPWQSSLPTPPAQAAAKPGGLPKRDWREFASPKRELKEFGSPRRMPENSPNRKFRAGESADSANKQRMNLPKGFSGERSPFDKSPKGGMREKNFPDKSPTSALGKKQPFSWEIANESLSPRTRKFSGESKLRPLNA